KRIAGTVPDLHVTPAGSQPAPGHCGIAPVVAGPHENHDARRPPATDGLARQLMLNNVGNGQTGPLLEDPFRRAGLHPSGFESAHLLDRDDGERLGHANLRAQRGQATTATPTKLSPRTHLRGNGYGLLMTTS